MQWLENTGRIMRQAPEAAFGDACARRARRARSQRIEDILRRRRAAGLYTARIWL
jgi:hypothetical protein